MDSSHPVTTDRSGADEARARLEEAVLGRYRIEEPIGRGTFSAVFRATDVAHGGQVAIKLLDVNASATPELAPRLESEQRSCASLGDRQVIAATSVEQHQSILFLVMPLVRGGSLAERLLKRGALPLDEVSKTMSDLAATLDRVHSHGITHRGLSPRNILFDVTGRLCIADVGVTDTVLGVAGIHGSRAARARAYSAPEQRRGQQVDGRADQYALAIIAHEMLTGAQRLQHESIEGIHTLEAIEVAADVPLRKGVPLHVNAALRRALSAGAANRFATTTEFAEALAGRGPEASPGLPTNRADLRLIRRRRIVSVVGALLAILACITIADAKLRGIVARTWSNVGDYLPGSSHRRVGVYLDPVSAPAARQIGQPTAARAHEATPSAPGTPRLDPSARSRPAPPPVRGVATQPSATVTDPITVRLGSSPTNGDLGPHVPGAATTVATGKVMTREAASWLKRLLSGSWFRGSSSENAYIHVSVDRGSSIVTIDGIPRGSTPLTAMVAPGHHSVSVHGTLDYGEANNGVNASRGDTVAVSFHAVPAQ
ncbi:MAG TPA: serine/threonine-protein kinase [Gemmatimonadaceae bacterium]|nr:serine/threonine-protein kinase [Gemmatimonadaceae bacterium]